MDKELKNIVKTAIIMTIFIAVVGLSVKSIEIYMALIVGAFVAIANFLLLQRDIKRVVRSGEKAARYAFTGYMKRYLFTIVIVGCLGIYLKENIVFLVPGLFIVKISIYLNQLIKYIKELIKERR